MDTLGILAGTAAALATVVAMPATDAHAQAVVLCSQTALRAAITQANAAPGPDTLFLAPGCTYNLTAADNPGNGLPVVTSDITIVGSFLGAQNVIRRQSATAFRIFSGGIANSGAGNTLNIRNSSVSYNYASEAPGGILNDGGTVTLTATPVQENFPTNCTPSVIAGCTG
ncbi:hypothetical protein ACH4U5_31660 [Streptomyces sp. NPDC020858]|uniref:hypothetical protein n=1 Tax=Streptomyces sp. NPDC020858 TaxID=3365097 RepID=UPI003793CD69